MTRTRKNVWKSVCSIVLVLFMLCAVFVQPASAKHYTFNDHKLVQGIGNVECKNSIDSSKYSYMWLAVRDAIKDWDWHLGLLNEEYGVDWNLTDYYYTGEITGEYPTIEFHAMTSAEFTSAYTDSYATIKSTTRAITRLYDGSINNNGKRIHADFLNEDWISSEIIFFMDRMGEDVIENYNAFKSAANHEIGHVLGLRHDSSDYGVIMYPYFEERTATVPTAKDLATVYYLYSET